MKFKELSDQASLGELFARYKGLVYGLCLNHLKSAAHAQDAVMDIFEQLPNKLKKHTIKHFRSWLYQVSKNHCLMMLRKKNREMSIDIMEFSGSVHLIEEAASEEDSLQALEKCLQALQSGQQDCVRMFFLQEKTYSQISMALRMEMKTVKSYIQNGKRNLKLCLEKDESDE